MIITILGVKGGQTRDEQGLLIAGQQIGHNGQAHKSRIAGAATERRDHGRACAATADEAVAPVAQSENDQLRTDQAEPEAAVGQIARMRSGQDMQNQQRQGQFEHIDAQGRAGALGQHVPRAQQHAHADNQKNGNNREQGFQHDRLPPPSDGRIPAAAATRGSRTTGVIMDLEEKLVQQVLFEQSNIPSRRSSPLQSLWRQRTLKPPALQHNPARRRHFAATPPPASHALPSFLIPRGIVWANKQNLPTNKKSL